MKVLITSGCSYSSYLDNWPYLLKKHYKCELHNLAIPSAGNDWIYRSILFGVHSAMNQGISTKDIVVSVLWTHFNRKSFYITKKDTITWDILINELTNPKLRIKNPANFIEMEFPNDNVNYVYDNISSTTMDSTWVVGNSTGPTYGDLNNWLNRQNEIDKYKMSYYENFYTEEGSYIENIEHILNLQWFCKSLGITLVNQSYIDLFYYPKYDFFDDETKSKHVTDAYPHLSYLYNFIDFSTWTNKPLHEYTKEKSYFLEGNHKFGNGHPSNDAHKLYVEEVLIPKFTEVNIK